MLGIIECLNKEDLVAVLNCNAQLMLHLKTLIRQKYFYDIFMKITSSRANW